DVLRIGIIQKGEQAKIIRASVYRVTRHLVTVAVDDKGRYVPGSEPPILDAIATAFDDNSFAPPPGHNLPRVYDRIDEIILFHRLKREEMGAIVDIQ
ncbi:M23 family peptidase, partial [Rhizobium leguminosarum]